MTRLLLALVASSLVLAQDPPTQEPPAASPGGADRFSAREPEPRPYEKVITKEAKTQQGVFTVHRIKSKLYYEIPSTELG
ncbi:MAG: DUF5118 domain-containing protein, partial [Acidobacteria bacterium]|nr:DUF5118 domain-containing protein [Acidobacteriota bacterium]